MSLQEITANPNKNSSEPRTQSFLEKLGSICNFEVCCLDKRYTFTLNAEEVDYQQIQKLGNKLGEGQFGQVDQVTLKSTNSDVSQEITRQFAVKRLKFNTSDSKNMDLIQRDHNVILQASKNGGRDEIVMYYGAVSYEGYIWIIMEKMEIHLGGGYDKVSRKEKLSFNHAARELGYSVNRPVPICFIKKLIYSLIEGLTFLLEKIECIHRDVKPSNVLLSRMDCKNSQWSIKICDFGISGNASNEKLTDNIGSYPYMAPERLSNERIRSNFSDSSSSKSKAYDESADVWSFGLVVMETMVGQYPYGHEVRKKTSSELAATIAYKKAPEFDDFEAEKLLYSRLGNRSSRSSSEEDEVSRQTSYLHLSLENSEISSNLPNPNEPISLHRQPESEPCKTKTDRSIRQSEGTLLMNFVEKCLIKKWKASQRTEGPTRYTYGRLKHSDYYQHIKNNRWDTSKLQDYFTEVFGKIDELKKERESMNWNKKKFMLGCVIDVTNEVACKI